VTAPPAAPPPAASPFRRRLLPCSAPRTAPHRSGPLRSRPARSAPPAVRISYRLRRRAAGRARRAHVPRTQPGGISPSCQTALAAIGGGHQVPEHKSGARARQFDAGAPAALRPIGS
jgi:hypothetical protein